VCTQFLVQIEAEHYVAVLAAFALLDMHHHARRIDIGEFEGRTLGTTHASTIEGHENGAIEGDRRGVNQAGDLLRTPDDRQVNLLLRIGHFIPGPGALQDLAEEKAQCADDLIDRVVREFPVTEKMGGVLTELLRAELVRRTVEIAR